MRTYRHTLTYTHTHTHTHTHTRTHTQHTHTRMRTVTSGMMWCDMGLIRLVKQVLQLLHIWQYC